MNLIQFEKPELDKACHIDEIKTVRPHSYDARGNNA